MTTRRKLAAARWAWAVGIAAATAGPGPARGDLTRDYVSYALQGDLARARSRFVEVPDSSRTSAERELAERFHARFVARAEDPPASDDPFVREVVLAYHDYWTRALMQELPAEKGEDYLTDRLAAVLSSSGAADVDPGDALARTGEELERRGWHHLGGITRPYFDLMLWSAQDSTRYDVVLTDGTQPVDVVFMSGFLVKGWSHFATFGRAYTGGWAGDDALYCLREDYDLDSEKFLISYLKHESRHYADYERFPELQQIDLEYRGKLTELAFARESVAGLLHHFSASGELNESAPHAFANHSVVRDVARAIFGTEPPEDIRWGEVDSDLVNRTARELLERNTQELVAAGADTVRGVVVRNAKVGE